MRIKEIYIKRYGPLQNISYKFSAGLNLLMGSNDQGKTLTIDALIKLFLVKKDARIFKGVERVTESPEGYIILEDEKKQELKVPEEGRLMKMAQLTPLELRNIFIIRNSDLSLENESRFYPGVADRLTGLHLEEIDKIINNIREEARITPNGSFINIQGIKLKDRMDKAEKTILDIDKLIQLSEEESFDHLEEAQVKLENERELTKDELRELENSRKREIFEKTGKALEALKVAKQRCEALAVYTDEDEQTWRDNEKLSAALEQEIKKKREEMQERKNELKELQLELKKCKQSLQSLKEKKVVIENEVKPDFQSCQQMSEKLRKKEIKNAQLAPFRASSLVLLTLSIAGSIINPSGWYFLLSAFFITVAAGFLFPKVVLVKEQATFHGIFKRIQLVLARYGLSVETVEDISKTITELLEEYSIKEQELNSFRAREQVLQDKIDELENNTLSQLARKKEKAEEAIIRIKRISGQDNLKDYSSKLREKKEQEKIIGEQRNILEYIFGKKDGEMEQDINYWEKKVSEFQEYRNKATGIIFSEKKVAKLSESLGELEEKIEDIKIKIKEYKQQLHIVESSVKEVFLTEEDEAMFLCRTTLDLRLIKKKLEDFIYENYMVREVAQKTEAIFEEIKKEEKEKVSELFGANSQISYYLDQITGGLYKEVVFKQQEGKLACQRRDGAILDAEKLSGGSYDQLYFFTRLALGKKILKSDKGFLILDDPFIKSDYGRLQNQLSIIKQICQMGWQVIYFSAKRETRQALEQEIDSGRINFLEMEGSLYEPGKDT